MVYFHYDILPEKVCCSKTLIISGNWTAVYRKHNALLSKKLLCRYIRIYTNLILVFYAFSLKDLNTYRIRHGFSLANCHLLNEQYGENFCF